MTTRLRSKVAAITVAAMIAVTLPASYGAASAAPASGPATVVINPGGGRAADGSDGIRFSFGGSTSDAVVRAGADQYCCSGGSPMLNIGGTLVGSGGPSMVGLPGSHVWDSFTVLATSGSATPGVSGADALGSGSATAEYTVEVADLTYAMRRTVSYVRGASFVTDAYEFILPEGNTADVKFYLGGDTAPGGSDSGYGIMLTSPVRSVLSLNPNTAVYFGFREVPGSQAFDGARSAGYYDPYDDVVAGRDIGFAEQRSTHDAGLMVQWNLGSAPGVRTAALRQSVSIQGTELRAQLDRTTMASGETAHLFLDIENTRLQESSGLGFAYALPTGITVGTGAATSSCGGTLAAAGGSSEVRLTGGVVALGSGCTIDVPVTAGVGTYVLSSSTVSDLAGGLVASTDAVTLQVGTVPTVTVRQLPRFHVGTPVDYRLTLGGTPAPTVTVTGGAVPAGLTLGADGRLRGTPVATGAWTVTIEVTNLAGTTSVTLTGSVLAKAVPAPTPTAKPTPKPTVTPKPTPAPTVTPKPKAVKVTTGRAGRSGSAPVGPGQKIVVKASGFAPGERVTVTIGGKVVGQGRANASGRVSLRVSAPKVRAQGTYAVVVRGLSSKAEGKQKVVLAPRARFAVSLRSSVRASDRQRVVVRGLLPGEPVKVRYRGKVVRSGKADASGRYATSFKVGMTWGTRTVRVEGARANRTGVARFSVVQRCFVSPRICP